MKRILIFALGMAVAVQMAFAAESTFSKDASHAFLIQYGHAGLVDLDLQKNACRLVDLSQSFKEPVQSVTLSKSGFILCATKTAVWAYDASSAKCIKVCGAPAGGTLMDIAYDPMTGDLLEISLQPKGDGEEIYCLPKNAKRWKSINNRYGISIAYPVFSADGTLFFASKGDLWMAYIEKETEDAGGEQYGSLVGYRCAPLANLIAENASPASTGLHSIAISQHSICSCYSRMGGSGWGSVIRFKQPAPFKMSDKGERDGPPVDETGDWKALQEILASVEIVADRPCDFICSSSDGLLTLFTNADSRSDSKVFLIQGDGKPGEVVIQGLADLLK